MNIVRHAAATTLAATLAVLVAAMPAVALAAEQGRAIEPTAHSTAVILYTVGAALALMLLSTVGYMYRRVRNLDWDFQRPDAAAHHEAH